MPELLYDPISWLLPVEPSEKFSRPYQELSNPVQRGYDEVRSEPWTTSSTRRVIFIQARYLETSAVQAETCVKEAVRRVADVLNLTTARAHLDELMGELEDYDEEFLPPTSWAYARAGEWLTEAAVVLGHTFPPTSVSPSGDGGIRLEWFAKHRSVRLVFAGSPEGRSYIHHRSGNRSQMWRLGTTRDAVDLAELLKAHIC